MTRRVSPRRAGRVPLARALSKLGLMSRSEAVDAILAGHVRIGGRTILDPSALVIPEGIDVALHGAEVVAPEWETILFHKPRGVVTTRRDPEGRPTVYDRLGPRSAWLSPIGRLDQATTGLLLFTNDTRLADWILNPRHAIPRVYLVTVRGFVTADSATELEAGIGVAGERLHADEVRIRKASRRETHLVVRLTEGRNREVRRLLAAIGHEVTSLSRVQFGGLELGRLAPGEWRPLSRDEIRAAFPGVPVREARQRRG
jgi:23S rRNA pseudouridine2605 synthase